MCRIVAPLDAGNRVSLVAADRQDTTPEAIGEPPGQPMADISTGPSAIQLTLVIVLVCALAYGAIIFLNQLDPNGPWRLMPIFALIVAVESVLTRRWLEWPGRKRQYRLYTLAELVVLLTLAPLFLWLASGQVPFPDSLAELLENPFSAFSLPLILYMLLALLVWHRAHRWAELLIHLSITPEETRFYTSTPAERSSDWSIVVPLKHRTAVLNAFVQSWIIGGVFLVVITALVSVDLADLSATLSGDQSLRTVTRLGLAEESLLALLVYFLGGLWLISQGRGVVLRGKWLADGSRRDASVVVKWRNWPFLLIGALSLLALFLPIGRTYPLLQALEGLVRLAYSAALAIVALLFRLLYFLVSLLPNAEALPDQPPLDPGTLPQPSPLPAGTTFSIPSFLAGSAFWLALLALTVVATVYFMSERGPGLDMVRAAALWRRFWRWLSTLGQGAAERLIALPRPIRWPFRLPRLSVVDQSPFRFLRVGGLPAREQVRFLYLSLVRHAARQGLPRSPEATPIEFTQNLKTAWPEAAADLDRLTEAFLVARYSAADVDELRLRSAKQAWLRIRRRRIQRRDVRKQSAPDA